MKRATGVLAALALFWIRPLRHRQRLRTGHWFQHPCRARSWTLHPRLVIGGGV